MSRHTKAVWLGVAIVCGAAGPARAEAPAATRARTLVVGTRDVPPFAMKEPDGTWTGLSIDLWRRIAAELGMTCEFRECGLSGLLEGLRDGSLDAAVAALTVTAEREKTVDFTHAYFSTGLGIAVAAQRRGYWPALAARLASVQFLEIVASLVLVMLAFAIAVWLFERRRNPDHFGSNTINGIGASFWWSAVTMTTVGYGDKAPRTLGGRLVAIVWMFTAILLISGFTGAIASTLTVSQLESPVRGLTDLYKARVATVADSTSQAFLTDRRVSHRSFKTPLAALDALAAGSLDAVVYDAAVLRHLAHAKLADQVEVLPDRFERQFYAIALPEGSPLREPVNRELLRQVTGPGWRAVQERYLGK